MPSLGAIFCTAAATVNHSTHTRTLHLEAIFVDHSELGVVFRGASTSARVHVSVLIRITTAPAAIHVEDACVGIQLILTSQKQVGNEA